MLEIAICDDEMSVLSQVEELVFKLADKHDMKIEVDCYRDGSELADNVDEGKRYDIIYLDIEMERENGVTVARRIREKDKDALLIYVTSHESFAKEAFEVSAYRFITKPIDGMLFEKYFVSACDEIELLPHFFHFQYNKVPYMVAINEIIYLQSDLRVTYIITKDNSQKCYEKLNDIEDKFNKLGIRFLRPHQSFLVNAKYIEIYTYDSLTLRDGTTISISARRRKVFNEQFCKLKGDSIIV